MSQRRLANYLNIHVTEVLTNLKFIYKICNLTCFVIFCITNNIFLVWYLW